MDIKFQKNTLDIKNFKKGKTFFHTMEYTLDFSQNFIAMRSRLISVLYCVFTSWYNKLLESENG